MRVQVNEQGGRELGWISVFVAALFVVTVSGVFAWFMRDELVVGDDSTSELLDEDFSGIGALAEPEGDNGDDRWDVIAGEWTTDAGKAVVVTSGEADAIALAAAAPPRSTIGAMIGGEARCGVVGRYRSPSDHVALYREPDFGVWNLVAVTSAGPQFLGNLPDSPTMDVRAELTVGTRVVEASVLGRTLTVVLDEVASDSGVGLIGIDEVTGCSWDDVLVESVP